MSAPRCSLLSLTELIAQRASDNQNSPAVYAGIPTESEDANKLLLSLSYSQLQQCADRLAWHFSAIPGLVPEVEAGVLPPVRIVAVLNSTSIDGSLLEIALAKLGLTALFISVSNSIHAVAHLIESTKAGHLVYGSKFEQVVKDVKGILDEGGIKIDIIPDMRFPLWGDGGIDDATVVPFLPRLTPEQERDRPAVVLHSSGSTGFPKPVYVTHRGLVSGAALNQGHKAFSTLPVFQGYGHYAIFHCIYATKPITLYPPHLPLTSSNICRIIKASPPVDEFFAVPYVIKLLGETEEGIAALANFKLVSYGGAALPDDLGDRLIAAGVNLLAIYGGSEIGTVMNSTRDFTTDKDWNWLRPISSDFVVFEPRGGDTYEVVVKNGYPPKADTNRPDGSYATKDLFVRHSVHPDKYKYIGRLDDTLVQTSGAKTNPVPMELCIRNSPYVAEAIVFGAGRPQTGVLILPSELGKDLSQEELMEKIWPVIEQANDAAPMHSRLLPEMVALLSYGTRVPVATKMSIIRPVCYTTFKDLISSVYDRFENGSGQDKVTLPLHDLEVYIEDIIAKAIGSVKAAKLTKDVDLFALGVDSLQSARIRNGLVKSVELNGGVLGQNVVYEHPSVTKLSKHVFNVQNGLRGEKNAEEEYKTMNEILDKYSAKLISHGPSSDVSSAEELDVVILTGASGSLGAHILAQLSSSPRISKIICITRANTHEESVMRLNESLKMRKLALSNDSKLVSYAGNVNDDLLGLSRAEYDELEREATIVIHNAWPVNFTLSLESYDEHIRGATNLMNLCLSSSRSKPAKFLFSSSISSCLCSPDSTITEEYPHGPSAALPSGYARSKWVVEKLCERAANSTALSVGVLRIGQIVGDTCYGIWNETEAWTLMFKGANTVGCLPMSEENVSWLPVDYTAQAIVEIILQRDPPTSKVYHVLNPHLTAWSEILSGLQEAGLSFEAVEKKEYVRRLEHSEQDPLKNPVIKLVAFFRDRYAWDEESTKSFSTDATSKIAPSIAETRSISRELVKKWVEHWRLVGFLNH